MTLGGLFYFLKLVYFDSTIVSFIFALCLTLGVSAYNGLFLQPDDDFPPRLVWLLGPSILLLITGLINKRTRGLMLAVEDKNWILIHLIRIPVELFIYWWFLKDLVPEIMTFTGRNFDILIGISAVLIYYFGFVKEVLNPWIIIGWNLIGLAFLINIVVIAIFSAPTAIQVYGFDQPNNAVLVFPYIYLPVIIVPLVFLAHVLSIIKNIVALKH